MKIYGKSKEYTSIAERRRLSKKHKKAHRSVKRRRRDDWRRSIVGEKLEEISVMSSTSLRMR